MSDNFFGLSRKDRRELLESTSVASGMPSAVLEKDIWVVWCLKILFNSVIADSLVFKGGTSLTKAFLGLIQRFSEDVDLACVFRDFASALMGNPSIEEQLVRGRMMFSPAEVREHLETWVAQKAAPILAEELAKTEPRGIVKISERRIFLSYHSFTPSHPYIRKAVKLEFSPCASREQSRPMPIECDLARQYGNLILPEATPNVMAVERTFMEKVSAMHAFCMRGRLRRSRFSRHAYDLAQLEAHGVAAKAIADRPLLEAVGRQLGMFYRQKDRDGNFIDFLDVVDSGRARIVPDAEARNDLELDYRQMIESGFVYGPTKPFGELMEICSRIERLVNEAPKPEPLARPEPESDAGGPNFSF